MVTISRIKPLKSEYHKKAAEIKEKFTELLLESNSSLDKDVQDFAVIGFGVKNAAYEIIRDPFFGSLTLNKAIDRVLKSILVCKRNLYGLVGLFEMLYFKQIQTRTYNAEKHEDTFESIIDSTYQKADPDLRERLKDVYKDYL